MRVVTLVSHGCPVQAIVAAFCLDERTVADWQHRAGLHCQKVHEEIVEQASLAGEVQADELLGQSSKSDSVARFINPRRDAALARWRDFKEQRQFADQKHVGESQTGSRRKRLGSALYRRFEKLCESNAPGLS